MPNNKKESRENEAFYENLRKQNLANRLTPEFIAYIASTMRKGVKESSKRGIR